MKVDFATTDDLLQMVELLTELFAQENDFAPSHEKQLRGLRLILETPALGQLFVLRMDGKVVGMANTLITISTAEGGRVLLLEDVIVHREHRGKGLGCRLLERVFTWAAAQGFTRISLLTDHDNLAAQAFYTGLGFSASGMKVLRKSL